MIRNVALVCVLLILLAAAIYVVDLCLQAVFARLEVAGDIKKAVRAVLAFGVGRFLMPTRPPSVAGTYQAFAHLFVGGLFGSWLTSWDRLYLCAALAMTALELAAFLFLR